MDFILIVTIYILINYEIYARLHGVTSYKTVLFFVAFELQISNLRKFC